MNIPLGTKTCVILINWCGNSIFTWLELTPVDCNCSLRRVVSPEFSCTIVSELLIISSQVSINNKILVETFKQNSSMSFLSFWVQVVGHVIVPPHLQFILWTWTIPFFNVYVIETSASWGVSINSRYSKCQFLSSVLLKSNEDTSFWNDWFFLWCGKLFITSQHFHFIHDVLSFFDPCGITISEVVNTSSLINTSWAQQFEKLSFLSLLHCNIPAFRNLIVTNSELKWTITSHVFSCVVNFLWILSWVWSDVCFVLDGSPVIKHAHRSSTFSKSFNSQTWVVNVYDVISISIWFCNPFDIWK